jgi:DNA excision repair protein ERCC-2
MWNEMKILNAVMKNKLLFVETTDPVESTIALENYKKACDTGRGAVLFSVARGIFFFSNVLLIFPAFQQCLR